MRTFSLFGIVLLGFVGAGSAMAQCNYSGGYATNNFCLTAGTYNSPVLDGIYMSPYTASINGGVPTYVICDDFSDEVDVNETWTVTSGTVGSSTQGLWGAENSAGYQEVAWLAQQLLSPSILSSPTQEGIYSYAIWSVFDPTDVQNYLVGTNSSYHDTATWNAVESLLGSYSGQTATDAVTVYTPAGNPVGASANQSCCGRPQEFLAVSTPEAPAPAILGIDMLGLGVLLFVFRRHRTASR